MLCISRARSSLLLGLDAGDFYQGRRCIFPAESPVEVYPAADNSSPRFGRTRLWTALCVWEVMVLVHWVVVPWSLLLLDLDVVHSRQKPRRKAVSKDNRK